MPNGGTNWLPIDKGVPLPEPNCRRGRHDFEKPAIPWKEMQVGDSVFIPGAHSAHISRLIGQRRDRCTELRKYTQRIVEGGVRIWRIE